MDYVYNHKLDVCILLNEQLDASICYNKCIKDKLTMTIKINIGIQISTERNIFSKREGANS